jgi:hypothetical protein
LFLKEFFRLGIIQYAKAAEIARIIQKTKELILLNANKIRLEITIISAAIATSLDKFIF